VLHFYAIGRICAHHVLLVMDGNWLLVVPVETAVDLQAKATRFSQFSKGSALESFCLVVGHLFIY